MRIWTICWFSLSMFGLTRGFATQGAGRLGTCCAMWTRPTCISFFGHHLNQAAQSIVYNTRPTPLAEVGRQQLGLSDSVG
ncbi:hypothetical protein EDC04DRAFT_2717228 [Pisolithus marmoratus]|nr:hypothetical protein EDC04DRAFT_2717228 [Pisolithus marmoratus]